MILPKGTDELLVAWLDNELSPADQAEVYLRLSHDSYLIERLAFIERSSLPFKKAFEPLLEAALAPQPQKKPHAPTSPAVSRRSLLIAAVVGSLALGVIGDRVFLHISEPKENWRDLVAQNMALYTPETLADTPTAQALETQLKTTGTRIGVPLTVGRLTLPNATLKNARILAYGEQPIAQITWLDVRRGPLALFIAANSDAPSAARSEQRQGMNIVYWADKTQRFMVTGRGSAEETGKIAGQLAQELSK